MFLVTNWHADSRCSQRILPSDYFTSTLLVSRADQRVLNDMVARHLPKIAAHLEDVGIELEAVSFGWFLSLFSLPLPIRTLLRVFDIFFVDGAIVLFVSRFPHSVSRIILKRLFCRGLQRHCFSTTPRPSWRATMRLTFMSS